MAERGAEATIGKVLKSTLEGGPMVVGGDVARYALCVATSSRVLWAKSNCPRHPKEDQITSLGFLRIP